MTVNTPGSASVEIVVLFAPQVLADRASALAAASEAAGAPAEPLHPGVDDPSLAAYAAVRVPADAAAHAVERLLATDGVAAAYVKPPAVPP